MTQKFSFIHIPKTAGTSISDRLWHYPGWVTRDRPKHSPAADLVTELEAAGHERHKVLMFSFIRNPWERVLSGWCYQNPSMASGFDRIDRFRRAVTNQTFPMMQSQWDMLTDTQGLIIPDFIGRYEHLEEDWLTVCRLLGIGYRRLARQNSSPKPHTNWWIWYDKASRTRVEQAYPEEVRLFGYRFPTS